MTSNSNNNNSNSSRDMDEQYLRVCICDCNTGRFITSLTNNQMQYIYDLIIRMNGRDGDYIDDPIAQGAIDTIREIKEYMDEDNKK